MTIPNYRAVEPLYIVILRNNNQAESLFRSWIKENRIEHANINGNRMMLHDQRAFEQFRVKKLVIWIGRLTAQRVIPWISVIRHGGFLVFNENFSTCLIFS